MPRRLEDAQGGLAVVGSEQGHWRDVCDVALRIPGRGRCAAQPRRRCRRDLAQGRGERFRVQGVHLDDGQLGEALKDGRVAEGKSGEFPVLTARNHGAAQRPRRVRTRLGSRCARDRPAALVDSQLECAHCSVTRIDALERVEPEAPDFSATLLARKPRVAFASRNGPDAVRAGSCCGMRGVALLRKTREGGARSALHHRPSIL